MDPKALRTRVAELLKEEMANPLRWWYISIAKGDTFLGGVYLKARGPTEAWTLLHRLDLFPQESRAETQTVEVPDEAQDLVERAATKHYRLLSRKEIEL